MNARMVDVYAMESVRAVKPNASRSEAAIFAGLVFLCFFCL